MSKPLRAQYNNWQMRKWFAVCLCGLASLTVSSRASATGKHISCELTGDVYDGNRHSRVHRTLNLYLDDTHAQLVGEGATWPNGTANLNVHTKSYSDAQVEAEISTEIGGFLFGQVTNGDAYLLIQRVTGMAWLAAKLLPGSAETDTGPCHEVTSPPAKF